MKPLLYFILIFKMSALFAQASASSDTILIVKDKYDWRKVRNAKLMTYADSINNYSRGEPLPNFLFDVCFDNHSVYWPDMHTAISVRWKILEMVNNPIALKQILITRDKRLKKSCDHISEKKYPYLLAPMWKKTFYQLIKKRYRELDN